MKKKEYDKLKIEIDMVSGKIFSNRGNKPSSTKSANTKHMNLLREIFQSRSAKSKSRIQHPKSLSRPKKNKNGSKKFKDGNKKIQGKVNSRSLSRSFRKKRNRLSGKIKNSKSKKYLKEKFKRKKFNSDRKRHRSLSGSRKRKTNYLTGNMANLKKKGKIGIFNRKRKSDWISDTYISKFSKKKREMLKSKMQRYGVKSFREWRREKSRRIKRKGSESKGELTYH